MKRERSFHGRGLLGLALCVVLSFVSVYRESLDTHAFREQQALLYSSSSSVPRHGNHGIDGNPPAGGVTDNAPLGLHRSDYYQHEHEHELESEYPRHPRPNGRGSNATSASIDRTGRSQRALPRVCVFLAGGHPPSHSWSSEASPGIFRQMAYLSNENNPLSSTPDSSATGAAKGDKKRNRNAKGTAAIRFVVLAGEDGIPGKDSDAHRTNQTMELPLPAPASGGERQEAYRDFERDWFENCEAVTIDKTDADVGSKKNQKRKSHHRTESSKRVVRPTCNSFHELDVVQGYSDAVHADDPGKRSQSIELLGQGSWRSVWKLNNNNNDGDDGDHHSSVVLKLLHTHHDFDEYSYSIHEMDAIVMEALTASEYVVDSYGFCGQSVLTEAATESGRSFIKRKEWSWRDRIKMARDLARGLADLHAFAAHPYGDRSNGNRKKEQPPPLPLVFAHHDVNPANVIAVHPGRIRWNDFNLGILNRYYRKPHDPSPTAPETNSSHKQAGSRLPSDYKECPTPIRYEQLLWRSPEECYNQTGTLLLDPENSGRNTAAQAADVYSLGNILFYVLARHQPWSHLEEDTHPPSGNETTEMASNSTPSAKLDTGSTLQNKKDSLASIGRAKVGGKLPNLPERYLARNEARLLWKAVQRCYEHDPTLRPTALEVAGILGDAYEKALAYHDRDKGKRNQKSKKPKPRSYPRAEE